LHGGGIIVWKVVRSILAVIAGFVAASVVMMVIEMVNGRILYPELGKLAEGVTDKEAIRALMANAPVGAFLVVLLGWVLGSLVGGLLAAWIGWNAPLAHALVLGGLLTLAGIANNMMVPPPVWFWIISLVVFLPAVYAGAQLAPRKSQARI
jgi:MFS family permease